MSTKIYLGNLSFSTTEETLSSLFDSFGGTESVSIVKDKVTGASKGFGFAELPEGAQTEKAIAALNGKEVDGRKIRVNLAMDKKENQSK